MSGRMSRRTIVSAAAMAAAAGNIARPALARQSTPAGGEWSYIDVLGNTVTLPEPPQRIAAVINVGASLWDFGIRPVAIFDWTASAYPDGDHIAWGNIDVAEIEIVSNVDGYIEPEALVAANPDIILTIRYDNVSTDEFGGITGDMLETIGAIAPVLVVSQTDPLDVEMDRLADLAASLGADLAAPVVVEAQEAFTAKVAEFEEATAAGEGLTALFASLDPGELYVAGPDGIGELSWMGEHGLVYANAASAQAGEFWETLSVEQAVLYPADLLYVDVYSTLKTQDEFLAHPSYAAIAAVGAGQIGTWMRDSPLTYAGMTEFLEQILIPLRTAAKVA